MARTFALLCLESWAGRSEHRVEVIGFTPRRVIVRAINPSTMPGRMRQRFRQLGDVAVPAYALREIRTENQ